MKYSIQETEEELVSIAIVLAGYAVQGRIGPSRPGDYDAETLLAQLAVLVRRLEP
jgi:hypothetical protein